MIKNDILSDVFATLRVGSGIYFRADLSGDFAVAVPAEDRLIRFHYVRRGSCLVGLADREERIRISEGDMAIVANGATHILADADGRQPVSLDDVIASGALDEDGLLTSGRGEGRVELLCGFCRFDEAIEHPAISHLPALILLRTAEMGHEPWLLAALRLLSLETDLGGQGMNGVLGRLLEILFIQTMRGQISGGAETGYLSALADPNLSRALLAIHREPEKVWTNTALAREAGMSRARFAARFTDMVDMPPIRYLTAWRLMNARLMLRDTGLGIDEIARRCGYTSLAAFTRRYSAAYGIGPGAYRRAERHR